MKIPACIIGLFFIAAICRAQETPLLKEAADQLTRAKAYTMAIAELMPEDKYSYKPVPDEMTFATQLLHIAGNITTLASTYLADSANPFSRDQLNATGKSKTQVLATLSQAFDFAISKVQNMNANKLDDVVNFFAGPLNKRQIINLMNDHQVHHRGQLIVYLRLNNIKPPKYVGW